VRDEIADLNGADLAGIQAVLGGYTSAFAAKSDQAFYITPDQLPYAFAGATRDLRLLGGLQYESGTFPLLVEHDAIVWANVVVSQTTFVWGKLKDGTLCVVRHDWPYMFALPVARFIEASHCNLVVGDAVSVDVVTARFIFDCLASGLDQAELQPLIETLEEDEQRALLAAAKAYTARWGAS
jgi:hypothetical protein